MPAGGTGGRSLQFPGMGIGIPGNSWLPRGGKAKISPSLPRRAMRGTNGAWGGVCPSPQTLLPTGCYPALGRDPRPRRDPRDNGPPSPLLGGILHLPAQPDLCPQCLAKADPWLLPCEPSPGPSPGASQELGLL